MLIAPNDLGEWMKPVTLDVDRAAASIRIAEGWLLSATRLDPWPDASIGVTIPEDLRAWCMELAALSYVNNPKSTIQRQVGGVLTSWAPDAQARREQIIAAAKGRYNQTGLPRGSFPPAQCWPDPARAWGSGEVYYR